MVLRIKPTPIQFPTKFLYSPTVYSAVGHINKLHRSKGVCTRVRIFACSSFNLVISWPGRGEREWRFKMTLEAEKGR